MPCTPDTPLMTGWHLTSPTSWHLTVSRGGSERVRLDTARLVREVDDKTRRAQSEVGKRLGDRIGDIHFWKTEVANETDNMITEIDCLSRAKSVLEKALAETENPLHIAQECLYNREKRQAIDLVHDNVEKELIKVITNTFTFQGSSSSEQKSV